MPGVALAQEDGVTIDPDSPSGKEYAIPLEQARRNAGAGGPPARVRPGERSAELFGAGVGDEVGGSARPAEGGGSTANRSPSPVGGEAGDGSSATPGGAASDPVVQGAPAASAGVDSADALVVGAVGLGALAFGAVAGVLLRRRLSRS
jgi:hypothetical protein